VATNTVSGVFRLLGDIGCCGEEVLPSLPVATTTAPATPAVADAQPLALRSATRTSAKKEVSDNA
jgi:hypothetical protein